MRNLVCLLSCSLFLLLGSPLFAQTQVVEKTYKSLKKIELQLPAGNITIKKSTTGDTQVKGEYEADQSTVEMNVNSGKLVIREKSKGNRSSGNSEWTLMVPNDIRISANTGSGNVEVDNVSLDFQANLGSGNFDFDEVGGYINVNTGSGNIDIVQSEADFGCNTGSGNYDVSGSEGTFRLNTGSGQVYLQKVSGTISANTGSGSVRGKEIAVTGPSGFNSGSGQVALHLDSAPQANLSVNSGSGNSVLDFNGQGFSGELVMECNKKHGSISAPFNFDQEREKNNGYNKTLVKTKNFGNSGIKIQVSTGSGQAKVKGVK